MKFSNGSRSVPIFIVTALCSLSTANSHAADSVGVRSTLYTPPAAPASAVVEVEFESKFGTRPAVDLALDKNNYRIVDLDPPPPPTPGQPSVHPVTVTSVAITTAQNVPREEWDSVVLSLSAPLEATPNRYVVIVS